MWKLLSGSGLTRPQNDAGIAMATGSSAPAEKISKTLTLESGKNFQSVMSSARLSQTGVSAMHAIIPKLV